MSFLSSDDLRDLNDPGLRYVSITKDQLLRAQAEIGSCKACNPKAEIPFDWLLKDVADENGYVDYVIHRRNARAAERKFTRKPWSNPRADSK